MGSNISVEITADSTKLRAQLAVAQQSVSKFGADLRTAAASIQGSGGLASATADQNEKLSVAAVRYNEARAEVTSLSLQMRGLQDTSQQAGTALQRVGTEATNAGMHMNHGITREMMVLGHEAMQGNFSKIPGSMMVLAERIEITSAAMLGAVGAAAALSIACIHLVESALKAAAALREVSAAAVLQGRSGAEATSAVEAGVRSMTASGTIWRSEAREIGSSIQRLGTVSDATRQRLMLLGPALQQALGAGDAEKAATEIEKVFGSQSSLDAFIKANKLLTASEQESYDAALRNRDGYKAQEIALDALTARIKPAFDEYQRVYQAQNSAFMGSVFGPMERTLSNLIGEEKSAAQGLVVPRFSLQGTAPDDSATRRLVETEQQYNTTLRERQTIEADIERMTKAAAAATDAGQKQELDGLVKIARAKLDALKDPGETGWATRVAQQAQAAGDAAVTAAASAGKKREQIVEAGTRAEMLIYEAASKDMSRTDEERNAMAARAVQLHMQLVKEDAAASTKAGQSALEAHIAELSAEQGADRDNYGRWMAIEQQKLAYLRQALGERSKQYQDELKAEETYEREHAMKMQAAQAEEVKREIESGNELIHQKKAQLDQDVADQQITRAQEFSALREFVQQQFQADQDAVTAEIQSLDQGTQAWRTAMNERASLADKLRTELAQIAASEAKADEKAAQQSAQAWQQSFSSIASSGERAVSGLIMGTETYRKAEMEVMSSVVESVAGAAEKMLERWVVYEIGRLTADTATQNAINVQQEAGQSGMSALWKWGLARFTSTKASETTASAVANMTQTTQTVAAQSAQTQAVIAGEAAKTSAVAAGAAASKGAQAAINGPTVMADAAKAAAGAYSAVAGIPYVGPVLAPIAAGVAFAAVSAYEGMASLDVGTSYVPRDMVAQIHQGEMVIPRYEADLLRGAAGGGGAASAGAGGDTHIHLHANINAWDTVTGAAAFQNNLPIFAKRLKAYWSTNPSMRPA